MVYESCKAETRARVGCVITIVICRAGGNDVIGAPGNGLRSIQLHGGTMDLHYDEALHGETNHGRFLADWWEEMKFTPSWGEL